MIKNDVLNLINGFKGIACTKLANNIENTGLPGNSGRIFRKGIS
jgi:hypothetical protein